MSGTEGIVARGSSALRCIQGFSILVMTLLVLVLPLRGQVTTATLSGTVSDREGDVIPQAKVVVTNRANKFMRSSVANGSGIFSFPGLDTGDYQLTITSKGFETFVVSTIHLDPGDARNINSIKMKPGSVDVTVTVDAGDRNSVQDTGERSSLITSKDLDKLSLEGREVTELLKILPGSAINTGSQANGSASSNTTYDPGQVGFGGAAGSYSMSGSPINGAAIRSDGANLTDPTSGAGSLQTVNAEATAEVKVQTANFGADSANGPLVINAVGKSGSSDYHGSIYVYGRTTQLNSTDSVASFLGQTKPPDRYIYPGGSVGGPIKIPGTNLNHSKKLTFFVSGEDYIQRNVYAYNSVSNAVASALVPTAGMLKGDFSAAEIAKYLPPGIPVCNPSNAQGVKCTNLNNLPTSTGAGAYQGAPANFNNVSTVPISDAQGNAIHCNGAPGNCLAGKLDPGAVAQFSLFPSPNTPGGQTTPNGYNYTHTNLVNSDIYQAHGRLDYNRSDRQKFFMTFTTENGATTVPQAQGYFASGNSGGVNTPGGTKRSTYTDSGSVNWNATFSNTLTNEFYASLTYSNQIDSPNAPEKLFNSAIGYPYTGAYANGTKQFPALLDYGFNGLPLGIFPDFSFGDLYNKAFVPGFGDNLTKLIGKHTVKVGVNVERPLINQTLQNVGGNPTNGGINNYYTAPTFTLPDPANPGGKYLQLHTTCFSPGDAYCQLSNGNSNYLANYLTGTFSGYTQANSIPKLKLHAWTTSMYVTDDWKITKNLSLTVGVRIDHIGRWNDEHQFGAAVFDPTKYATDGLGSPDIPLPGFRWHSNDASIPVGGFPTRIFFYQPRVGFNWDVYGNGKTSVSGGWGQYRFRDGQADAVNSLIASNGLRNINISNPGANLSQDPQSVTQAGLTMKYVQSLHIDPSPKSQGSTFIVNNSGFASAQQTFYGVDKNDSQAPLTTNYNLTVTQQFPGSLVFSIGYVGNNSNYLLDDNGNGPTLANINALPVGALFQPNPNPQSSFYGLTYTPSNLFSTNYNDYRKYKRYSSLQVESHILTANYNAMQLTLNHYKGAIFFGFNYTYSRNMGVKGGYSNGNAGDSFNERNDYGPLAYDRTHIANASYSFDLGSKYHGYRMVQQAVNGWQISGYTGIQSGPNLQSTNYSTNFGLNGYIPATGNQNTYAINNVAYLGTPDVSLQPKLTCDPRSGVRYRQYMRSDCFALPAQGGDNGPFIFPYIHGPAYFQSDLTLSKKFSLKEKQALEIRAAAFNFLNYKLPTFSGHAPGQLALTYPLNNNPAFGASTLNSGRRVMEIAVRYTF